MATVKFADISPYQAPKREQHHTDFKYTKFLQDTGVLKRGNSDTPKDLRCLNVALFGLGRAGSIHAVNILSNRRLRLMYIVEEDLKKAELFLSEYNLVDSIALTPAQENVVFTNPKINGIIVATPTFTHENLVTKGLKAGKAILCEKPISQDQKGTAECYEVAQKVGKPLLCAFNRRYDPAFKEVQRQVRDGRVGKVHLIKTIARDSPLPSLEYLKISGGIFHDCGVHDIDLICWVLGEYPEKVFAAASAFIPEIQKLGDYDTVAITLQFSSGTLGMIDLSRNAIYGYDQRLEVFGPKGMINASNESPIKVSFSSVSNQSQNPIYHSFPSRYEEGYRQELNHFCDIMQGRNTDIISGENTLKISKIASALEESVKTGQLVTVKY